MATNIKIGYIGGGSMNWAWAVMSDLALEPQLSGEVRLYDIDFESAKANETIGNRLNNHKDTCSQWNYKAYTSLEETLTGVDFVIISILPGTFDEMESDIVTPEQYGIYHSVGDTTGPAGIVRSMRTVPMMVEIAEAIQAFCPEAWVINYTNPMAICVNTLYQVFPKIKAFGCCHEVFHTQAMLSVALDVEEGTKVSKSDIRINVQGVNHFVWVDRANYKDLDLMPIFARFAKKHADSGYTWWEPDRDTSNHFRNTNQVCFNLFNQYGAIPSAGDRHIAEFMPPWFLKTPETPAKWGFALTPVSWRKQARIDRLAQRARILSGEEAFNLEKSNEEGTELMKALLGISEMTTNVNLPNIGQMDDIPRGVVVETNAIIRRDAVYPICAGRLPGSVHSMVDMQASQQEMLMQACLDKDLDLAFHVFQNDNLVQLDPTDAKELFIKMLENTKEYLPGWDIDNWR